MIKDSLNSARRSTTDNAALPRLLAEMRRREPALIDRLSDLVKIESPSNSKAGVDRAQTAFANWAAAAGGKVHRHRSAAWGDSIAIRFAPRSSGKPGILLLGHMDTVHEAGTLTHKPFKCA